MTEPEEDIDVLAQQPLAGVIMCCTSISPEERSQLADVAIQMGATHKYDLTSDVTHLIVGSIDTPKYRYVARERQDVKVVLPEWVEAIRQSWMQGGHTDVSALEEKHKAPVFFGLHICMTGFEDLKQRSGIIESVQNNGGRYQGDLTRSITHLIAANPSGKKYEHAMMWNIKIVSLEWLHDSIERGMTLEEQLYSPLKEPEKRGNGAWKRPGTNSASEVTRSLSARTVDTRENTRKKLRRTASVRLEIQSEAIWADITLAGGAQKLADKQSTAQEDVENIPHPGHKLSNHDVYTVDNQEASVSHGNKGTQPSQNVGLFEGRIVLIEGFTSSKCSVLQDHLYNNGAFVMVDPQDLDSFPEETQGRGFRLLPHDIPFQDSTYRSISVSKLTVVSTLWVEKCLHRKQLLDPMLNVLCQPFSKLEVEVVKLMGATYSEFLNFDVSVLVCNTKAPKREKLLYALEHNIHIVDAEWLWSSIGHYKVQPFEKFPVPLPRDLAHFKRVGQPNESIVRTEPVIKAQSPQNSISEGRPPNPPRGNHQELSSSAPGTNMTSSKTSTSTPRSSSPPKQSLQDLPPEMNSPKKSLFGQTLNPSTTEQAVKPSNDPVETISPADPPPTESESLQQQIAQLFALKQAQLAKPKPDTASNRRDRRRKGLLGRAQSGQGSGRSLSATSSIEHGNSQKLLAGGDGSGYEKGEQEVDASQRLGYEDEDARVKREEVIRRMGGRVEERVQVERIGTVKDVETGVGGGGGGVGERVRRRRG
ncbi:hypothetical protein M501DRAFT_992978 [Patellaria atrata CBS 101060]|uniref:BRCT domain-containing protein n=1 Tax=Patellaria atrata CBS 101060 TaxID=1346257 RepID=A0A9P4VM14_9PEZI|nr:hypothetical protein M501DRAFT_992978 [Patellaria atrata CBS 101060]